MLPWDFQLLVATRPTETELIMPTLLPGVCRGRGVVTPFPAKGQSESGPQILNSSPTAYLCTQRPVGPCGEEHLGVTCRFPDTGCR